MAALLLRRGLAVAAVALVLLAGCADDDDAGAGAFTTTTTTTTTTTAVASFDFGARATAALTAGWTIGHCEGDAPLFCVSIDGTARGVVELLEYPISASDAAQQVLQAGGSNDEALRAQAIAFQETFEKDRRTGCGPDYTLERYGPRTATVAGLRGIVYGFDASHDGRRVERALQFAVIDDDVMRLLATSAVEEGTCLDDGESIDFAVAELDAVQPHLERLVATARLP